MVSLCPPIFRGKLAVSFREAKSSSFTHKTRLWFQIIVYVHFPFWLIFFKWVGSTTNYKIVTGKIPSPWFRYDQVQRYILAAAELLLQRRRTWRIGFWLLRFFFWVDHGCRFVPYTSSETIRPTWYLGVILVKPGFGFDSGPNLQPCRCSANG